MNEGACSESSWGKRIQLLHGFWKPGNSDDNTQKFCSVLHSHAPWCRIHRKQPLKFVTSFAQLSAVGGSCQARGAQKVFVCVVTWTNPPPSFIAALTGAVHMHRARWSGKSSFSFRQNSSKIFLNGFFPESGWNVVIHLNIYHGENFLPTQNPIC